MGLSIAEREAIRGKCLLPPNGLPFFGGICDAAPDAWRRRVIEAKLRVPANSLPESQYLLHAGSERVGALDIRSSLQDGPTPGASSCGTLWPIFWSRLSVSKRVRPCRPIWKRFFRMALPWGARVPKRSA